MNASARPPSSRGVPASSGDLYIRAAGLCCATGNHPYALLGAVGTNLTCAQPLTQMPIVVRGETSIPIVAPVDIMTPQLPARQRILRLLQGAVEEAAPGLGHITDEHRLLVHLLLPDTGAPPWKNLDTATLVEIFKGAHPVFQGAEFCFGSTTQGATAQLDESLGALRRGERKAVLFCGVDTLFGVHSITELAVKKRLFTTSRAGGIIPGEGAACLLIEKEAGEEPLAFLAGLGHAPEPNTGQGAERTMNALHSAIEHAMTKAVLEPNAFECLVQPLGMESADTLEWYQVGSRLWRPKDGDPPQVETLHPFRSIGETGAASLPLALALGCARFAFDYPPVENVLVLEAGSSPWRGAVCLKRVKEVPA